MPDAAEIDPLVLQLDDRGDRRKAVEALEERILDGLADTPREGEKLRRGQALIAEEDDEMAQPRGADRRDLRIVEAGQVDVQNLGADRPGDGTDLRHQREPLALQSRRVAGIDGARGFASLHVHAWLSTRHHRLVTGGFGIRPPGPPDFTLKPMNAKQAAVSHGSAGTTGGAAIAA